MARNEVYVRNERWRQDARGPGRRRLVPQRVLGDSALVPLNGVVFVRPLKMRLAPTDFHQ